MLMSLQGKVTHRMQNYIILENAGVGYQIFFSHPEEIALDAEEKFFIYEHIREDRRDLYGFLSLDDLSFFHKLLSVDGVGPKMAQNISALGLKKIQKAVAEGNASLIESVHGVGRKTAQKIVLELKGSLDKILSSAKISSEALEALTNLGYRKSEAEGALQQIGEAISGTEAQIRAALKLLGRK